MFVILFGSFHCAMLGPLTMFISLTGVRLDRGRAEVATIAIYSPLISLHRAVPPAREPVRQYLDWWDLSRW